MDNGGTSRVGGRIFGGIAGSRGEDSANPGGMSAGQMRTNVADIPLDTRTSFRIRWGSITHLTLLLGHLPRISLAGASNRPETHPATAEELHRRHRKPM